MIRFRSPDGVCWGRKALRSRSSRRRTSAVGRFARRLDRGEAVGVGEEVGQRGLELDAAALVLLVREDVRSHQALETSV